MHDPEHLSWVFPAYAGMFREIVSAAQKLVGFPRIRGDVPGRTKSSPSGIAFSPHTRGCSYPWGQRTMPSGVFPAYAGMFRQEVALPTVRNRFPRIRGDVPLGWLKDLFFKMFSPHTRGCSSHFTPVSARAGVFPAYAGMFRPPSLQLSAKTGFPRIRGDVPAALSELLPTIKFSPHTRGCSFENLTRLHRVIVFPAYAGMFRRVNNLGTDLSPFSPHTRGCSRGWFSFCLP